MKPAFFFNVRHNQDSIKKLKAEEKKDGVSMTPCFINTPSNSSQFGSLNGTGSLDPLILSDAIWTHKVPELQNTMYRKEKIAIQSFGGDGNIIEECHI